MNKFIQILTLLFMLVSIVLVIPGTEPGGIIYLYWANVTIFITLILCVLQLVRK